MHQTSTTTWSILFFILSISSCGYHFPRTGGVLESSGPIFIRVLENKTTETGVENIVTRNLIDEFTLRKENNLARDIHNAEAFLHGTVSQITIQTIAAKGKASASERRVTVSVSLKLTARDGSVMWAARDISEKEAYPVSEDKNATELSKRLAIDIASKRIAERAVNRLTDDF